MTCTTSTAETKQSFNADDARARLEKIVPVEQPQQVIARVLDHVKNDFMGGKVSSEVYFDPKHIAVQALRELGFIIPFPKDKEYIVDYTVYCRQDLIPDDVFYSCTKDSFIPYPVPEAVQTSKVVTEKTSDMTIVIAALHKLSMDGVIDKEQHSSIIGKIGRYYEQEEYSIVKSISHFEQYASRTPCQQDENSNQKVPDVFQSNLRTWVLGYAAPTPCQQNENSNQKGPDGLPLNLEKTPRCRSKIIGAGQISASDDDAEQFTEKACRDIARLFSGKNACTSVTLIHDPSHVAVEKIRDCGWIVPSFFAAKNGNYTVYSDSVHVPEHIGQVSDPISLISRKKFNK